MKTASILIQFRNRCHYIEMCLTRILANTIYPWDKIKLRLVDDASDNWVTERIGEIAYQHDDKYIEFVKNKERIGTTESFINFLRDHSESDYLLKIDSDLLVCRGWLTAAIDWMENHPEVSLANFRLTYLARIPKRNDPWMRTLDNLNGALIWRRVLIRHIDMDNDTSWVYWTDANWQKDLNRKGHKLAIMPIDVEHISMIPVFGFFGTPKEKGPHSLWLGDNRNKDKAEEWQDQKLFTEQRESYGDFDPETAHERAKEIRNKKGES